MRILAVLGIEVTACVTILARITRRPPPVDRTYTQGGKRRNQAKGKGELGRLRSARSEDRRRAKAGAIKQERQMRAIRAKMIDEPPVECFHTGRPARQNRNKGQITIPILGLGSRTPTPKCANARCLLRPKTPNALKSGNQVSAASCRIKCRNKGNKRAKRH